MNLDDAITGRRSVRKFSDYYVTNRELRLVIEAARNAPSWANTQVWDFIVLRDREIIRQVTETYTETNPARRCSLDASAVIAVCAKTGVSGCRDGKENTKFHEWFMFDLGCAVQNLCLKAHDIGLGTVVVGLMDHDSCEKILGVPEGHVLACVVPIGKPATDPKKGPARKELRELVRLDTFEEHFTAIDS